MDDQGLEAMFAAERAAPVKMPDGLMQRVLADADALQVNPRKGIFPRFVDALGGASGMGGLVTATCVGFWLGVAPPEGFPDVAGVVLGIEDMVLDELEGDALNGFGWDIEEGDQDG